MKKLVFLKSRAHFRGGLEKYTQKLAQAFVKKGCDVSLLTTGYDPKIEGVKVFSLAPDTKFTLYHLRRFDFLCKKWLQKHPHEIVFGMERNTVQTHYRAGSGVHAVYLKRRKMIDPYWKRLSFLVNPLHRQLLAMEKKAFESPELKVLFTNSHMVRHEILQTYSTDEKKIEVIHNGVDWENWGLAFEQSLQNTKQGPYRLLFVGNGYKRKGLHFLLAGLGRLKKEDFRLTVVGKDKNVAYFMHYAENLGLENKVSFLGPQNNMLPFYQSADALVIPTIYDPFANVTLEALAMGLYVVSSRYNGATEILQDGAGTMIDELMNPESVATSLKKALGLPKTYERAQKIRQSIKELDFSFQLDKIVRKTLLQI